MSIRHPSLGKLRRWIDTGAPLRVGSHVDTCDRCAALLEQHSALSDVARETLRAITQPSADLDARMRREVDERIQSREAIGVVGDLFGLGWYTASEWMRPEDDST